MPATPGILIHVVGPGPSRHGQVHREPLGAQSHRFRSEVDNRPQIAFAQLVGAKRIDLGPVDLIGRVGNLKPQNVRRI